MSKAFEEWWEDNWINMSLGDTSKEDGLMIWNAALKSVHCELPLVQCGIAHLMTVVKEAECGGYVKGYREGILHAAEAAEAEPRVWDINAPDPQHRIAAKLRQEVEG